MYRYMVLFYILLHMIIELTLKSRCNSGAAQNEHSQQNLNHKRNQIFMLLICFIILKFYQPFKVILQAVYKPGYHRVPTQRDLDSIFLCRSTIDDVFFNLGGMYCTQYKEEECVHQSLIFYHLECVLREYFIRVCDQAIKCIFQCQGHTCTTCKSSADTGNLTIVLLHFRKIRKIEFLPMFKLLLQSLGHQFVYLLPRSYIFRICIQGFLAHGCLKFVLFPCSMINQIPENIQAIGGISLIVSFSLFIERFWLLYTFIV